MYKCLATEEEIKSVIKERRLRVLDSKWHLQYGDKVCLFSSDGNFDLLLTIGTVERNCAIVSNIEIMASIFFDFKAVF